MIFMHELSRPTETQPESKEVQIVFDWDTDTNHWAGYSKDEITEIVHECIAEIQPSPHDHS